MPIQTVADLNVNQEYYMTLLPSARARKIKLLGILQINGNSEIYIQSLSKVIWYGCSIFTLHEIGIGTTTQEAKKNYELVKDVKLSNAYASDEALEKDLQRDRNESGINIKRNLKHEKI